VSLRSRLRSAWLPLLSGAIVGLSGWLVGVVPLDAALLASLVALALLLPRWVGDPDAAGWPGPGVPTTVGGWYEVRRLGNVLGRSDARRDTFATRVRPRLRVVAERRLARLGVRWDEPAARRLLGPDVYDLLDGPGGSPRSANRPPVALTELALGRLDELPEQLTSDRTRGDGGTA
jgi:hypothetical protein